MSFPWLSDAPASAKSSSSASAPPRLDPSSRPAAQQHAHLSHFNAAAEIEDAMQARFLARARVEQQLQQQQQGVDREAELQRLEALRGRGLDELPPGVETDWAGFVVQPARRKVFPQGHVSRDVQLQSAGGYIVPKSDATESGLDAPGHSKKHFENDQRFETREVGGGGAASALPHRSAAYQRGPGCAHDTAHWKTSYQSAVTGERAGLDHGFLNATRGVPKTKKYKPAFEQASAHRMKLSQMPLADMGNMAGVRHHTASSLGAGSMAPRIDMSTAGGRGLKNGSANLLSGLGARIANSIQKPERVHVPAPQDKNDKQMLTQNWHHAMPGTTTRRRVF
jgi:hypothetical protein